MRSIDEGYWTDDFFGSNACLVLLAILFFPENIRGNLVSKVRKKALG